MRQDTSIVENLLWSELRECRDIRFRRQHPIHPYIVDFACLTARLVIEIDGMSHDCEPLKDIKRQKYIEQQGFRVIRFANKEVIADVDKVAEAIFDEAQDLRCQRWKK